MIQSGRYLGGRQVCLSVVVFSVTISLIVCLLARSYEYLRGSRQPCDHTGRDYLSADRRCFLYWYWNPLFTIWILQSGQQTGHVRCFDGDISRKQSRISVSLSRIPVIGVIGIWVSISIGWFLADLTGILYYKRIMSKAGRS